MITIQRKARKPAIAGIYHAILRGINKQPIFENPEDYNFFSEILRECKELYDFKIYPHCLMGNPIQL
jgi:REP element-mobilizing transposase RayT